ncbi:MAG: response regulator [Lachnospiraceae bacterium]|nr:response regulator [Lachnospiraceae bacterium]
MKVFLVEDEFVVREGIKKNVDWAGHGYDFCGEASDGELAWPMIQKERPDIVITDIKMPFMDGLELTALIKKELPQTEVVILSGYAEFEYAQEAMRMGVAHYLTKPIRGEELLAEIDVVAEKIRQRRQEQLIRDKYRREMAENRILEQKKLFQNMVSGSKKMTDLLEDAQRLQMDISAIWYNIVLIKFSSIRHTPQEYSGSILEAEQKLEEALAERRILLFDRNTEGKALLVLADSEQEAEDTVDFIREKTVEAMGKHTSLRYFAGVGEAVNRLGSLPRSFETAGHAFAYRYLLEENRFLRCSELGSGLVAEKETDDFSMRNLDPREVDRNRVQVFLRQGDREEIRFFLEEFFNRMGSGAMRSLMFRKYIAMDVYFAVSMFYDEMNLDRDQLEEFAPSDRELSTVEGTIGYLSGLIDRVLELRDRSADNRYDHLICEVKEYIEQNYADEHLSLQSVSSYVNFSPNHLSTIFSQQTGMTFIRYLTDYRMNKAKELLRCTSRRSADISVEVGYKDPHYFSYLFKKTQGMTPTQYRSHKET